MGTEINCMSCICYVKLKEPPSLKMVPATSVQSATSHDLCPVGIMCCEVTLHKSQFQHTFIVCKKLLKELVIGLDMQMFHHTGETRHAIHTCEVQPS